LAEASAAVAAAITAADIEARARARLCFDLPERWAEIDGADGLSGGGDHVLDGRAFFTGVPRAAAVLVGIVTHHPVPTVLLTTRLASLRQHSGQVAFPGGKVDASDASPLAAALREAEEEVGLDRGAVTPLGYLDTYLTGTGFMVMPALCLIRPPLRLRVNPAEVADAFEVPLPFLMDPANHRREAREVMGRSRHFYAMTHGDRTVWGATAGMLRNLYERLYG
jgi:8-oxo-dGTP pyrophosphatase MutT (NUDIX family)